MEKIIQQLKEKRKRKRTLILLLLIIIITLVEAYLITLHWRIAVPTVTDIFSASIGLSLAEYVADPTRADNFHFLNGRRKRSTESGS
ncbi:hypothetical protein TTRE_0000615201 [Trichuris trichiura]|uniref:Uncharacterized protein n=1 Tax=Trichuris trichiura TaxID=36087 RepID=A0A077ZBU3_TRITR|nr:hypothetical protein TTRE_0000615201 [Trichuris trichiura]